MSSCRPRRKGWRVLSLLGTVACAILAAFWVWSLWHEIHGEFRNLVTVQGYESEGAWDERRANVNLDSSGFEIDWGPLEGKTWLVLREYWAWEVSSREFDPGLLGWEEYVGGTPTFQLDQARDSWVYVPYWMIMVLAAIPTIVCHWRSRRSYPAGHCQHCGYNLTGLPSNRCPECGEKYALPLPPP